MPAGNPIEVRCPIYGFIQLDPWEREIIEQPAFQRLRRIRQLAWTDYVYPGAMHSRFEHSLGVMHMATMLYDAIADRCWEQLKSEFGFDVTGRHRYRKLVRFAALLHDIGHGPFSHAVEELAPDNEQEKPVRRYRHEEYSAAIIRRCFRALIEQHKSNSNYKFVADEVAELIEGRAKAGPAAFCQELISGQLDADRMDYLLRDSHHAGVEYGRYDWRRIVGTVALVPDPETGTPRLGIADDGRHAVEGLIIARYMMFNQVYFHKTRVILDHHLHHAVEALLPGGRFPKPVDAEIDDFLGWDDWRVLGLLAAGNGGDHGRRLATRNFFRMVWETPEFPEAGDEVTFAEAEKRLLDLGAVKCEATKSWYKVGAVDLPVASSRVGEKPQPLSLRSTLVGTMKPTRRIRLYVAVERRNEAVRRLKEL